MHKELSLPKVFYVIPNGPACPDMYVPDIHVLAKMIDTIVETPDSEPERPKYFNRIVHFVQSSPYLIPSVSRTAILDFVRSLMILKLERDAKDMQLLPLDPEEERLIMQQVNLQNVEEERRERDDWQMVEQAVRDLTITEHQIHVGKDGPFLLVTPKELVEVMQSGAIKPYPMPLKSDGGTILRKTA